MRSHPCQKKTKKKKSAIVNSPPTHPITYKKNKRLNSGRASLFQKKKERKKEKKATTPGPIDCSPECPRSSSARPARTSALLLLLLLLLSTESTAPPASRTQNPALHDDDDDNDRHMSDVPPPPPLRIYEILIDRFARLADAAHADEVAPPPPAVYGAAGSFYYGGCIAGISDGHLAHLHRLGFTHVLLTPFMLGDLGDWQSYHGYHIVDLGRLDPRLVAGWDGNGLRPDDATLEGIFGRFLDRLTRHRLHLILDVTPTT
ncbi:hypothetical protein PAPYR_4249 [Paratrimastix pyriformis]|uniref:Glycosyl hydrolase family 13 catalytic domain-containing protein n=1 Tax=Paratrimastix pyriformis TaxID=342808 RepID=A0ABQ8UP81_9EUKA|nr:hypothetical protein PAPYR_4249 [Paratrimastix pyriformis]